MLVRVFSRNSLNHNVMLCADNILLATLNLCNLGLLYRKYIRFGILSLQRIATSALWIRRESMIKAHQRTVDY